MANKNVTLKDLVDDLDPEIRKLLYSETRDTLNQRPHVLDLSYRALKINNQHHYSEADFREIYNILIQVVTAKIPGGRQYAAVEDIPRNYFMGSTPYLVLVNGGPDNIFLMAKSFDAIRKFISNSVSNDKKLKDSIFGQRVSSRKPILNRAGKPTGDEEIKYATNVELGHTATRGQGGEFLTSPFAEKVNAILEYGELSGNSIVKKYAEDALNKLYSIQADIDYGFKNTTPEVFEGIENTFGEMYIIVTLHTFDVNQEFSREEAEIFRELERKIATLASKPLVAKYMQNMISSNTMLQDIEEAIVSLIRTGKQKTKRHGPKKKTTPKKQVNKNKTLPKDNKISGSTQAPKQTPTTVNLVNLQMLLNSQLQDVISANMGDGSRRDILNYRTGRFASTAEVERLSISREGMITAFYSYMKYPYATFSTGGRQEYPRSRDPKLLISKSIRQIAAEVINNRLRAVVV